MQKRKRIKSTERYKQGVFDFGGLKQSTIFDFIDSFIDCGATPKTTNKKPRRYWWDMRG